MSYRDLEELAHTRGTAIDHSTLQRWIKRFVPLIDKQVEKERNQLVQVGVWIYLYRAVNSLGNTIEFLLRKRRDKEAAKAFFRKAFKK